MDSPHNVFFNPLAMLFQVSCRSVALMSSCDTYQAVGHFLGFYLTSSTISHYSLHVPCNTLQVLLLFSRVKSYVSSVIGRSMYRKSVSLELSLYPACSVACVPVSLVVAVTLLKTIQRLLLASSY